MLIDPANIQSAIDQLKDTFQLVNSDYLGGTGVLRQTFSTVSGLNDAGLTHSTILDTDAIASQKAFADRFANASNTLSTNLADFIDGDQAIAGTLSSVGLNHALGDKLSSLRASGPARNTDTSPFHAAAPVVARPSSLIALCGQFAATNFGIPAGMTTDWTSLASTITAAAASLEEVLADLHSSAETEAISQAIANITTLRNTGLAFANNATLMAGHTTGLGTGSLGLGQQTASVGATYQALRVVRPDAAALLEQTYLNAFPGLATAALAPSIPAINQLLPGMNDPSGTSAAIGGSEQRVPEPTDLPLPPSVAAAMTEMGYGTAARISNPQSLADEFLRTGPEQLEQVLAGHAPTTTAATAVAMPPTLNPGGQGIPGTLPGASVTPQPSNSLMGAPVLGGSLPNGTNSYGTNNIGANNPVSPATAGVRGAGSPNFGNSGQGAPVFGAAGGSNSPTRTNQSPRGLGAVPSRVPNSPHAPSRGGIGANGSVSSGSHNAPGSAAHSSHRSVAMPNGSGFYGSSSNPYGSSHTLGGDNRQNGTLGPNVGGHSGTSGSGSGNHSTSSQNTGSQHNRGFVPAAMAPGARNGGGPKSTAGAVKKVTSAVEREGNLKALLGPGPEVVPGVIGAWVREPKR
ncbi:hypothetical protein [Corynebacterium lubricantis]|uniref:hypothetical protein n=1 Tax=Corynebacterium lubricantis TaxID=541095 RepID=UPI00036116D9|nr:hypothetical protein [Corynebacterium lubricantis]